MAEDLLAKYWWAVYFGLRVKVVDWLDEGINCLFL